MNTLELIANVRSRANIEHTRHVTDDEIVTWLNDEGDEIYKKVIASRQNFVSRTYEFTLGTTTFVRLEDDAIILPLIDYTVNNLSPSFPLTFSPISSDSKYKLIAFIVEPTATCNTGDTALTFAVNATPTLATVTIPDSTSEKLSDTEHEIEFTGADTISVINGAGAGAGWTVRFTVVCQIFEAQDIANAAPVPSDFWKPIAMSLPLDNGASMPILPLPSLNDKTLIDEYRYWISDQSIRIYPETNIRSGTYVLEYNPRWQKLQIDPWPNSIMSEMEQFSEIICLGAASMAKLKRKMNDDALALRQKQIDMEKSAIAAIPGRVGSPKQIPMPKRDLERRYGWYSRLYRFQ